MLILDTDHMSELVRGLEAGARLSARLANASRPIATSIVTVEEILRGQLAQISSSKSPGRLIVTYGRAQNVFIELARWSIVAWDARAASLFEHLRAQRLGVSTMDLRIASIVLANDSTLLSRNLKDFERVPDLKVEDWLS